MPLFDIRPASLRSRRRSYAVPAHLTGLTRRIAAAGLAAVLAVAVLPTPGRATPSVSAGDLLRRPSVIVAVRSASDIPAVSASVRGKGASVARRYRWNALLVSVPAGMSAAQFARTAGGLPGVRYAQVNGTVHAVGTADDPLFPLQWGATRIGADVAWDVTEGQDVPVAVLDSGIDTGHRDLAGAVPFHNYVDEGSPPLDDNGHGTLVAGVIAATRNNALDIAGVAPRAKVYAFKVLGADGDGTVADVVSAIRDAVDLSPCRIISMSFGASAEDGGDDPAFAEAVQYARSKGVVLVAAAGNQGDTRPFYPASFPGVLGVGATTPSDARATYSDFGDGIVDLAAPGDGIVSTYPGDRTSTRSGTSMAAPHVSGAAALVMARYPGIDATHVVDLLRATATDLGLPGDDVYFGSGLVRADIAVLPEMPDAYEPDDTTASAVATVLWRTYGRTLAPAGERDLHAVDMIAGRTYRIVAEALVPGTDPLAEVLSPDGTTVLASGDDVSPTDPSAAVSFTPTASGLHYVRVSDPRAQGGLYSLEVRDRTAADNVVRLGGLTRYDSAVRIASEAYPGWMGVRDVVVASGEDRAAADPLSAAALCALYRAPLLLTKGASVSPELAEAIAGMPAGVSVHIVGGPGTVTPGVEAALRRLPRVVGVERISGADRYAVGANVAARVKKRSPQAARVALVANGANPATFFDALALSAVSSRMGFPILLVRPTGVPAATAQALRSLAPAEVWVAGGTGTVSAAVFASLGASGRWAGPTRYETAVAVAEGAMGRGWLEPDHVAVAARLPDALTGGSALGARGVPVLVTRGDSLSGSVGSHLSARRESLWGVYVLGGAGSVSEGVRSSIVGRLE